jgi:hypothetical protein
MYQEEPILQPTMENDGEAFSGESSQPARDASKRKNMWSAEEARTLIDLIKQDGVVKNGTIQYQLLYNKVGSRTDENIRDKIKNWKKKYEEIDPDVDDVYYIQAKEVFDHVKNAKQVLNDDYYYFL